MKQLKYLIYNNLIRLLDLCKRESSLHCGLKRPDDTSFKSRQLIQHGNAGNNLPGRKGKISNSLLLYDYAIKKLGFKMVECDVRMTSDKVPVLCHDPFINNVASARDGSALTDLIYVNQTTYRELQNYNWGGQNNTVVTLKELMLLCSQNDVICHVDVNCDVTKENVKIIYDVIEEYNMLHRVFIEPKDNSGVDLFMELDLKHVLSYQLDKVFSIEGIDEMEEKEYRKNACNIIISKSMPQPSLRNRIKQTLLPRKTIEHDVKFEQVINYGHEKGYIMKVTTINDSLLAKYFFSVGIDLVSTDCLLYDD